MNFCFDMDGTIADLYSQDNWLDKLRANDASPYRDAKPMINASELAREWHELRKLGHRIIIISWCSKGGSTKYNKAVRTAKIEWLKKHNLFEEIDSVHIVAYGTPKHYLGNGILFDDVADIRKAWRKNKTDNLAYSEKKIFQIQKKYLTNT